MTSICDDLLSGSDEDEEQKEIKNEEEHEENASTSREENESSSESGEDEDEEEESEDEEEVEEGKELEEMTSSSVDKSQPLAITEGDPNARFSSLGLSAWILDQLKELNLKKPTPVQQHCIPKVLEGSDVLGCAKTGTGKTMAFALPILEKLSTDPFGIFALVLTPTRELAFQIGEQFQAAGAPIHLKCSVIVGGRDQVEQSLELMRRPHVVVATPGRLSDHLESHGEAMTSLFNKLAFLVLDEADRLLDGQYALQIKNIVGALPKKRQTLLFSATITSALTQLHQVSIRKPFFFEDQSEVATVEKLEQKYVLCPQAVKDAYLVYVVKNYAEKRPTSAIIIFAHTCRECQALAHMFSALGFSAGSLHSQIPQSERLASLAKFRAKRLRVLICTDVASRGLDIPHVDLVVNHSVPQCPKTYVHRVGRSARAGRYGSALSFVTQYDVILLQAVEKLIGKQIEELKVNEKKVSKYVTQVLVTKREAELRLEQQRFGERSETNRRKELLISGMDEEDVDRIMDERKKRMYGGGKRRAPEGKEEEDKIKEGKIREEKEKKARKAAIGDRWDKKVIKKKARMMAEGN